MLIQLRAGMVAVCDDDINPDLLRRKWFLSRRGHVQSRTVVVARAILGIEGPKVVVRYRDGDPLNLQRANLEAIPRSHAAVGRKRKKSPSRSKYRGVHWSTKDDAWFAGITVTLEGRRVRRRIGPFRSEASAARAWDCYISEMVPGFSYSKLNFPG